MKKAFIKISICSCVLISALAFSAANAGNVSPVRHPNLAAAQKLIEKAIERVTAAQVANAKNSRPDIGNLLILI